MRKTSSSVLALAIALFATVFAIGTRAQNAPAALVIEGGTLIDGNGGAPCAIPRSSSPATKSPASGRKGQLKYPPNAQVINADGKFIIPGLIDSHGYGTWFINDMYINHGVTSTVDNGLGGELSIVHREAVNRGKIAGPRYITSIGYFSTDKSLSDRLRA